MSNQKIAAIMNEAAVSAENSVFEREAEIEAIGSLLKHYASPTRVVKDSLEMLSKIPVTYTENKTDLRSVQLDLSNAAENSRNAAYWFREAAETLAYPELLARANDKVSLILLQLDELQTSYIMLDSECEEARQLQDKIRDLKTELASQTILYEFLKAQ